MYITYSLNGSYRFTNTKLEVPGLVGYGLALEKPLDPQFPDFHSHKHSISQIAVSGNYENAGTGSVLTHHGSNVPMKYNEYIDLFIKDMAEIMLLHWPIDHEILSQPKFNFPPGLTFNI